MVRLSDFWNALGKPKNTIMHPEISEFRPEIWVTFSKLTVHSMLLIIGKKLETFTKWVAFRKISCSYLIKHDVLAGKNY